MAGKSAETLQTLRLMAMEQALRLRIQGGCMSPLLESGAIIRVKAVRFYWPGDCLVFAGENGRLTAHRLLGCYYKGGRSRYLTQADRAQRPDRYIASTDIIGKICGGECDPRLISVPFKHRLRAIGRFCRFVLAKFAV